MWTSAGHPPTSQFEVPFPSSFALPRDVFPTISLWRKCVDTFFGPQDAQNRYFMAMFLGLPTYATVEPIHRNSVSSASQKTGKCTHPQQMLQYVSLKKIPYIHNWRISNCRYCKIFGHLFSLADIPILDCYKTVFNCDQLHHYGLKHTAAVEPHRVAVLIMT